MAKIKLIKKDTDLSILHPVDWDAMMNGEEYQVFRADGYVHTIGGHWGENYYWACPRNKKPTFENLVEFDGHAPTWGITIQEKNAYKCKWNEPRMRGVCSCVIARNGKPFYTVSCNDIAYGYAEAYRLLRTKIQEGVINFHAYRYWEKYIEGRHILYKGKPYTLYQYMPGQCCAMAVHGHITEKEVIENDLQYGTRELKLDLLMDGNIDWFPNR